MASAYKRGHKWVAVYKGTDGKWHSETAGTDRAMALRVANARENDALARRKGLIDPRADGLAAAAAQPLAEHLAQWRDALANRRGNDKYATLTYQRAKRVLRLGKVEDLAGITPAAVDRAVKGLREGRVVEGDEIEYAYSKAGIAHHLRAVKMFSKWLRANGRTREDWLFAVKVGGPVNPSERVRVRRALSQEEFTRLVASTQRSGVLEAVSGGDRAMLYQLAGGTGFRASELASLTPASFALDQQAPVVSVTAAYSKRKRDDHQPITAELAAVLTPWLASKAKGQAVFRLPRLNKLAGMLRTDMRRAKAAWIREAAGRQERRERQSAAFLDEGGNGLALVDLHTLRVSYISWLVEGGASVKTCQELARHSTPVLTIGTYARMSLHDQGKALAALPVVNSTPGPSEPMALRATGTEPLTPTENPAELMRKTPGKLGGGKGTPGDNAAATLGGPSQTISSAKTQKPASMAGFVATGRSGIRTHESRICNPLH